MRRGFLTALLLVVPLGAFAHDTFADPIAPMRIGVALHFEGRAPSQHLVANLQAEVEEIWRPYGVEIGWSELDDRTANATIDVNVKPRSRTSALVQPGAPLGSTRVPRGVLDHVRVELFQDQTDRVLDGLSTDERVAAVGHARVDDPERGRALGRVLAHELGHLLLGQQFHPSQGLMRASFTGGELLVRHRDFYRLSETEVERLGSRVRALDRMAAESAAVVTYERQADALDACAAPPPDECFDNPDALVEGQADCAGSRDPSTTSTFKR